MPQRQIAGNDVRAHRLVAHPDAAQAARRALPGRTKIIEIRPFSYGKPSEGPDRSVDTAFRHGPGLADSSHLHRGDHLDRPLACVRAASPLHFLGGG
jgi:hypothetical protein